MKELRMEQKQQQRIWLELQIREKRQAKEEEKIIKQSWHETENITIKRQKELALLENNCKKKLIEANHYYNQSLVSIDGPYDYPMA